ncbi:MAG: cadherin-like domain-containing protein [Actinomycetota bacterium]
MNHAINRSRLGLWAGLAVLLVVCIAAPKASGQLARVGPIQSGNGFPSWYQDTTGLAMDFCLPLTQAELNAGWCLILPASVPNGTAPEVFPGNFSIENFYASASSGVRQVTVPGFPSTVVVLLTMDLEASFANGFNVVPGDQITFARTRIKISPVPFDGTYTVYTPVGKFVFPDQVAGQKRGIFFTEDIGLGSVGNFNAALGGRMGPFLLPSTSPGGPELPPIPLLQPGQDPFYDALVAAGGATADPGTGRKYIADPARLGPLTGGKTGIAGQPLYVVGDGTTRDPNIFRVEGPNGWVFESTGFNLMGRIFEGPIAGNMNVDRASYARSAGASTVDVYATASPTTQGRIPATPPPSTVPTQLSYYDAPCTPTFDAAGNPGPPFSAPAGLSANQMFASTTSYFGESHPSPVPSGVCIESNAVNASGQTVTTYLDTALSDQVFITEALFDPVSQSLSVKATSSDQVVAQTLDVEGLGAIDPATGRLLVNPLLAPPATVRVISSGGGINEFQVSTGAVAGGTTTLPIAQNDAATTLEDTPVIINVLPNDVNVAGGVVSLASLPALGTAQVNADGSITYTPNLNANGTDSFTYHVTVGTLVTNDASVTVAITPVNDPPVAVNDTTGALRGFANSVNVLANDTDPDGAADLASAVIVTGNANLGIAAGSAFPGGIVTFTPPATTAAGSYTFTYNAIDQAGAVSATPATVTVTVSTTEAIVVAKSIYTQNKGRWTVSGTVSPTEGQTITIAYDPATAATYKVNGQCTGNAAGIIIGTAAADSLGNWLFDQILNSTSGILNPSNTLGNSTGFWCTPPKTLRITSSLSGISVTAAISLK